MTRTFFLDPERDSKILSVLLFVPGDGLTSRLLRGDRGKEMTTPDERELFRGSQERETRTGCALSLVLFRIGGRSACAIPLLTDCTKTVHRIGAGGEW
jgi:hypothetical protein